MYDVIVVGAGPAGSTTAKFLSEKGFKVLLLDKDKFPRVKPCGGGIPNRVFKRFPYIVENQLFDSYSYGGRLSSGDLKDFTEYHKSKPIVGMVLRKNFDNGLLKAAENSGTIVKDGKKVIDVKIIKDGARVIIENNDYFDSQIIIGGDGVWSTSAKKLGLLKGRRDIGLCVLKELPFSSKTLDRYYGKERFCHIHLRFNGVAGYGWVFPKKNHLNIGISEYRSSGAVNYDKHNLKNIFFNYIKILKENKIIPPKLKGGNISGGAVPIYPLEKTYSDRFLLCGDAGGFINPISGEGIYYAMSSGQIAATVAANALESGKTDEKTLSIYQKMWNKDFGKDITILSRYTKNWIDSKNTVIKYTKNDKKLADMALSIFQGDKSLYDYKWKIMTRALYVFFRDFLRQRI
jgi:geranylgeranyl reductase family protein